MQASRHNALVPGLADDHFAIAHAHCRLKTQPERWFDEPAKVRFSFPVEYPKDKGVDIINRVQISRNPKFR